MTIARKDRDQGLENAVTLMMTELGDDWFALLFADRGARDSMSDLQIGPRLIIFVVCRARARQPTPSKFSRTYVPFASALTNG
jgi:hypothetical protein